MGRTHSELKDELAAGQWWLVQYMAMKPELMLVVKHEDKLELLDFSGDLGVLPIIENANCLFIDQVKHPRVGTGIELRNFLGHNDELLCFITDIFYLPKAKIGCLKMRQGNCCDMDACVALFTEHFPDVEIINTVSGDDIDTSYVKEKDGWLAVPVQALELYHTQRPQQLN